MTPDELPYDDGRLHVEASVSVDGVELSRTSAAEQHWSWEQVVEHAGRDMRLRAGDVLGPGTLNRGCLLEQGPLSATRAVQLRNCEHRASSFP